MGKPLTKACCLHTRSFAHFCAEQAAESRKLEFMFCCYFCCYRDMLQGGGALRFCGIGPEHQCALWQPALSFKGGVLPPRGQVRPLYSRCPGFKFSCTDFK